MFADDTTLFFSGDDIGKLNSDINQELNNLAEWFKVNKLSLNIKKTNYIFFCTKNNKINPALNISIDGVKLLEVMQTKFRGVVIIT